MVATLSAGSITQHSTYLIAHSNTNTGTTLHSSTLHLRCMAILAVAVVGIVVVNIVRVVDFLLLQHH